MASANPYLNFSGTCRQAFEHYRSVFGGEFEMLVTFADMPADDSMPPMDQDLADQVAHVSLPLGDSTLMGSDVPAQMGTVTPGNSTYVCVSPDTVEEAERVFGRLMEGGETEMPFGKQSWGDYFGSGRDEFGVSWMLVTADPEAPAGP